MIVAYLVNKFLAFNGTRYFKTVFAGEVHWTLLWTRWIQSSSDTHILFLRCALMLSHHLCARLPTSLFHSGFKTRMLRLSICLFNYISNPLQTQILNTWRYLLSAVLMNIYSVWVLTYINIPKRQVRTKGEWATELCVTVTGLQGRSEMCCL
jgi:hypothetical protein